MADNNAKTINPDIVGRAYPPATSYTVGREKIREFARAVKATSPLHFDVEAAREAGYTDLIAPPTFAIILAQAADAALIQDESAGIDFSRVVHADQRFTHHRSIVAGDELLTAVHVDSVRVMGAGAMLTTREEITTIEGDKVATCVSSLLVRAGE
ncbi:MULTISPECIES: MaoC family dehydratase N-terminal domain-containing protein [unclassified Rothia (in: high G+C Gram-positive bacteria)]|uniref:MaoC family dehydratase N-terminal domain-containing protein n=1 Tax=unclassified Rothia (in: high G+C Gram-positive bacteria) TaxID=2689056 RepID=UPI0019566ECE|nr:MULTISPECIES: MaoC family dehydratase N-terminal domain-containing protein [unclassified Rothia (in: high G+C Gram-positive bacteria)]MBM7051897.1 MaoC family dehydratase N-terminal domain-containing protein [Rothia sp. ZJ1223]QRZ62025.1 MaoC family dehydratase N-terminal domain-containing protein [Rothia sp. ZJ932]